MMEEMLEKVRSLLGPDAPDRGQYPLAPDRIGEAFPDVGQHPAGPLDSQHSVQPQTGLGDLLAELVGQVEIRGGEPLRPPGRVAVLAID
jgi:hypothetical protein